MAKIRQAGSHVSRASEELETFAAAWVDCSESSAAEEERTHASGAFGERGN
jgi:hypothetical protein